MRIKFSINQEKSKQVNIQLRSVYVVKILFKSKNEINKFADKLTFYH